MNSFALILFFVASAFAAPNICSEQQTNEMDISGQNLFLIGDRNKEKLPDTLEMMEGHCTKLKESQSCITDHANSCLDGMAKQVTTLLVKGASTQISEQCDGEAKRQEFIKHTPCFNHDFPKLHGCMESYVDKLQGLKSAKKDDKIPLTCCNYYAFRKCIDDGLTANGDSVCLATDKTYMTNMLNGFASEVLGMLCARTPPNSDVCNVLISPDKDSAILRTKSILPPFIDIFSKF